MIAAVLAAAVAVNDISVALPALDGLHGAAAAYERFLPERHLSLAASAQLRQSASGDFLGLHTGVGAEVRWYWRANRRAWLSRLPAGSMAGWFLGTRADVGLAATRDTVDERWLGTAVEVGATALVGYRIAPWRGLEITPSFGLGARREFATPAWTRPVASIGLSIGWLY